MSKVLTKSVISAETVADVRAAVEATLRDQGIRKGPGAGLIVKAANEAEGRLAQAGVAMSNRPGCEYEYREAGPWANAYKNSKAVARFRLRRAAKGWLLVSAGNDHVYPKTPEIDRVVLTAKAKEAVIRKALAPFSILPEKVAA